MIHRPPYRCLECGEVVKSQVTKKVWALVPYPFCDVCIDQDQPTDNHGSRPPGFAGVTSDGEYPGYGWWDNVVRALEDDR